MRSCNKKACWALLAAVGVSCAGGMAIYYKLTQTRQIPLEEALERLGKTFQPQEVELLLAAVGKRASAAVDSLLQHAPASPEAASQLQRLRDKLCPNPSPPHPTPSSPARK